MTFDPNSESISEWLADLKGGDSDAAQKLWERYSTTLLGLARQSVSSRTRPAADEEDVLQDVFLSLCRGAAAGRFEGVQNRDELWWLLLTLTRRKGVDQARRDGAQRRGAWRTTQVSQLADRHGASANFQMLVSEDPTPEFALQLSEWYSHLMSQLRDDSLRLIARLRIEGFTAAEIAQQANISLRSVERKLNLIRSIWSAEMDGEN